MEAAALCYTVLASLFLFLIPLFAFFFSSRRSTSTSDQCPDRQNNNKKKKKNPPLPPSPPSLPVLGHLHLLKPPVPRTLADLSRRHGAPVLLLRLGTRRALLVTCPSAAEECFTTNDVAFASRPRSLAGEVLSYGSTTITTAPYGQLWRDLRRIATVEVLSIHRLQVLSSVRAQEVRSLAKQLFREHPGGSSPARAALSQRLFGVALNNMTRMTTGRRYYGEGAEGTEQATKFQEIVEESLRLRGNTNRWDFLPWLRWLDLKGVKRRMLWLRKTRDVFLQRLVEEHRGEGRWKKEAAAAVGGGGGGGGGAGAGEDGRRTAVDVLLSLQEGDPGHYTDDIIKSFVVGLLSPGSDTTAMTTEWAMTLLLNHPQAMQALAAELDAQVQPPGRMLDEGDFPRLPFLHAVVSETLRLHPAAPLLVPHESTADCTVAGFHVPRGTALLVNAWAIHRDPALWEDPDRFRPERFLHLQGGGLGRRGDGGSPPPAHPYRFIPFGAGRRRCPGEGMAVRVVALALGTLVQCFEWERVGDGEEDMREGTGITSPKAKPLEAMYRPRDVMVGALSQL